MGGVLDMPQLLASADQVKEASEHASIEHAPVLPAANSWTLQTMLYSLPFQCLWTLLVWDPPTHCSLL